MARTPMYQHGLQWVGASVPQDTLLGGMMSNAQSTHFAVNLPNSWSSTPSFALIHLQGTRTRMPLPSRLGGLHRVEIRVCRGGLVCPRMSRNILGSTRHFLHQNLRLRRCHVPRLHLDPSCEIRRGHSLGAAFSHNQTVTVTESTTTWSTWPALPLGPPPPLDSRVAKGIGIERPRKANMQLRA
jgi:hypothetical protein